MFVACSHRVGDGSHCVHAVNLYRLLAHCILPECEMHWIANFAVQAGAIRGLQGAMLSFLRKMKRNPPNNNTIPDELHENAA